MQSFFAREEKKTLYAEQRRLTRLESVKVSITVVHRSVTESLIMSQGQQLAWQEEEIFVEEEVTDEESGEEGDVAEDEEDDGEDGGEGEESTEDEES